MTERTMATAWADLLFPRACAGCGAVDTALCETCESLLCGGLTDVAYRAPYLVDVMPPDDIGGVLEKPRFPVYALAEYAGEVQSVVVRWKNTRNTELRKRLEAIIAAQSAAIVPEVPGEHICVVPAPSRWQRTHDGRFVAGMIAQAVVVGLSVAGWRAEYVNALVYGRAGGGGRLAGRRVKAGSIRGKPGILRSGSRVVLADDVLTTGATLSAAGHAIEELGGIVVGAVVLAVAYDPRGNLAIS